MDTAAVEFEEFLSRSVSQLITSVGGPHGRRQASRNGPQALIPLPVRHHKPCGSQAGTGHNLTERVAFPPPSADLPRMVPPWPACQK